MRRRNCEGSPAPRSLERSSIAHSGWEFQCVQAPIFSTNQLFLLGRQLANPHSNTGDLIPFCVHGATRSLKPCTCGAALVMGVRMHMPESVFGDNLVELVHAQSGVRIRFTALAALRAWARSSIEKGSRSLRVPPGQLPQWKARLRAARARETIDYDWTFCCDDFVGTCESTGVSDGGNAQRETLGTIFGQVGAQGVSSQSTEPPPAWTAHTGEALAPTGAAGTLLRRTEPIIW